MARVLAIDGSGVRLTFEDQAEQRYRRLDIVLSELDAETDPTPPDSEGTNP